MDKKDFELLITELEANMCMYKNKQMVDDLCIKYKKYSKETISSIVQLWRTHKAKKQYRKIKFIDLFSEYKELAKSGNKYGCMTLSLKYTFPPALICKGVLQGYARSLDDSQQKREQYDAIVGEMLALAFTRNTWLTMNKDKEMKPEDDPLYVDTRDPNVKIPQDILAFPAETRNLAIEVHRLNAKYDAVGRISKPRYRPMQMFNNPFLIEDQVLREDVMFCFEHDDQYSPVSCTYRACLEQIYETKLKRHFRDLSITYSTPQMTEEGQQPNFTFASPINIRNRQIYWAVSKPIFCDNKTHRRYLRKEYKDYCKRFGSGLVIYWFGMLKSVPDIEPDELLIMDSPPKKRDIRMK